MDENQKKEVQEMIDHATKMHRHNGVLTQNIYLQDIFGSRQRWYEILNLNEITFGLGQITNGTTPVHLFSGNNSTTPAPFLIISMQVTSLDTTAATITLKNGASTVATVAKGTVAGVITGATSVANNSVVPNTDVTIVSSSAGNALVQLQVLFPFN